MSGAVKSPDCWLVLGLPWPQDAPEGMAECALALAPSTIPRTVVSRGAAAVLDLAQAEAQDPWGPGKVVFFSDITLSLDSRSKTWGDLGIDHEAVLGELAGAPVLSLYLTLSRKAHVVVCSASREGPRIYYSGGEVEHVTRQVRQDVHDALAHKLAADWPVYIQGLIDQGALRP